MSTTRFGRIVTLAAVAAFTAVGVAVGAGGPELGPHVSGCAREHLGSRPAPPTVTCSMPDGTVMVFPTFGAMVRHMQAA
jgi:hypothetical protein